MRYRFKVGDVVRCKKKYSGLYNWAGMDALCKVVAFIPVKTSWLFNCVDGIRKRMVENIRVKIIAHKREGEDSSYVGQTQEVYDFHFKKADRRDEETFILYRI